MALLTQFPPTELEMLSAMEAGGFVADAVTKAAKKRQEVGKAGGAGGGPAGAGGGGDAEGGDAGGARPTGGGAPTGVGAVVDPSLKQKAAALQARIQQSPSLKAVSGCEKNSLGHVEGAFTVTENGERMKGDWWVCKRCNHHCSVR